MMFKDFMIAYYLFAMISVRYALKWKGNPLQHGGKRLLNTGKASTSLRSSSNTNPTKEDGHQTPTTESFSPEADKYLKILQDHQKNAARLSNAEEIRTLLAQSTGYGVLSTNNLQLAGYPSGSVVGFQLNEEGKPFFVFSTMSSHTKDILADGRSSLVVTAKDFKGAAEGRVSILGDVSKVLDAAKTAQLRELYLSKHKDAYWIDFGYFEMATIKAIRYVGGFARAGSVTPEEYFTAKPDPISAFAEPVMKHMNEDHSDSTQAMIQYYVGVPCSDAKIINLDRLGMTVLAKLPFLNNESSKIRLPFVRPVEDRKQVKEILVEMTKNSATSVK